MKFLPLILACGLIACEPETITAIVQPPYVADSGSIAVRCGSVIDGLSDTTSTDRIIVIRDGRFDKIESSEFTPIGMPVVDLSEYTCLPGLINTHVHLGLRPEDSLDYSVYYRRTTEDNHELVLSNAKTTLFTGFTTVRQVGAYFPNTIYYGRKQIRSGLAIGPRIRTAGPYLTIPAGGGDLVFPGIPEDKLPAASQTGVARGPTEFRENARIAVAGGADFLKVIASGAVFSFGTEPGEPEMNQEEIAAVVEIAHEAGIKVTAHVHSALSGKDAILAGVDSMEHASLLDDETIAMAAKAGVALSMDVYNGTYTDTVGREQGYHENFLRRNFETTEMQRVVFEKAYALGIPIMYGTDAGVLPHNMGGWQFQIMVERGMTPMDAIKSATSVPADHMGIQDDVGALEAGRYGDLIAVRGNPLEDMTIMRDVKVVIKGGLVFKADY